MGRRLNPRPRVPLPVRLWAKIAKAGPNDCWPWTGFTDPKGRGRIYKPGSRSMVLVYRAAYEDAVGPVPAGLNVLHRCDNPPCCNPAHLWLGTTADNNEDMHAKGRWRAKDRAGVKNANARLAEKTVLAIRAAPGRYDDIALAYGTSHSTVSDIKNRKTWKHI